MNKIIDKFKQFLIASGLILSIAKGVQIQATFNKGVDDSTAKYDSVQVKFKPLRPNGTYNGICNNDSGFVFVNFPQSMMPSKKPGDTLEVKLWDNEGHYTFFKYPVKTTGDERVWDSHVSNSNAKNYTVNWQINDVSGVPGNMIARIWYDDAPGEFLEKEIPSTWGFHYADYFEDFNKFTSNATPGRAYTVRITKPGVSGYTEHHGIVGQYDAGELSPKIFPESGVGVEEEQQQVKTAKPKTYFVDGLNGHIEGKFYNSFGKQVNGIGKNSPAGIYFDAKGNKYIKVK